MRDAFMPFGQVGSVRIMSDEYIRSGQVRKYAFVEMQSVTEGESAVLGLDGKLFSHRVINVLRALPLSNNGAGPEKDAKAPKSSNRSRQRR